MPDRLRRFQTCSTDIFCFLFREVPFDDIKINLFLRSEQRDYEKLYLFGENNNNIVAVADHDFALNIFNII